MKKPYTLTDFLNEQEAEHTALHAKRESIAKNDAERLESELESLKQVLGDNTVEVPPHGPVLLRDCIYTATIFGYDARESCCERMFLTGERLLEVVLPSGHSFMAHLHCLEKVKDWKVALRDYFASQGVKKDLREGHIADVMDVQRFLAWAKKSIGGIKVA